MWTTPTLQQVTTDVIRGFNAGLTGADAALARNNLFPVAKVLAGHLHELHGAFDVAVRQRFVLTCDDDFLDRHGAEMKPPVPRKAATPATGILTIVSTGAASVAGGAVFTRSDGARFLVQSGLVLASAGTGTLNVVAEAAGAAGNTGPGAVMSPTSGVTGTLTASVASGGLGAGADIEGNEAYRARLLFAKAFPEHAGAPADWLRYTLAVPGVTRAYIDPLAAGRGTVVVYPFFDLTRTNGIPLESDRLAVETALASARPGAGLPVVRIAEALPVNVMISGLFPSTPEVRTIVETEIRATFARQSRPSGISEAHGSMPFLATPQIFSRSWIWQAAANASGEERHAVLAPDNEIILAEGQVAVPGTVSFV